MNSQTAFKMCHSLNLHFTSLKYSVLTYGNNTKSAQKKWDVLSPSQRFRYEWLAQKYPVTQDLVYACIGSQFADVSMQFGEREEIVEAFFKFKARREALTHTIKSDLIKHELIDFEPVDKLIFKYFVGDFSPEYLLLITKDSDVLLKIFECPNFSWARIKILKLIKYRPFFNVSKYAHLTADYANHVN